ncbi:MAG: ATP-binding cassette domain-containing protein [Gammaproteobacteria bacterium]|nr:ATP-binding cassette domain-containing protein [Gammaproteobacteria bacterium]
MPSVETPVIETHHLSKQVAGPEGELVILREVDLAVRAGEALAIVGASGTGKSTLLGLLAGLDTASAGRVNLFGRDLSAFDEDGRAALRAGRVGFVFQSFQLLPGLTALENVMLPLELNGASGRAEATARDSLARVGLTARARHYPHQLSGGEQQRVAIARAFAPQPRVLFADEPTGNLDQNTGRKVIELLFSLRDEHAAALVMVTHDTDLTAWCDRRQRLAEGRLGPADHGG